MCTKPDFNDGIHDCALSACPADQFASVTNYATALCASKWLPAARDRTDCIAVFVC